MSGQRTRHIYAWLRSPVCLVYLQVQQELQLAYLQEFYTVRRPCCVYPCCCLARGTSSIISVSQC